MSVRIQVLFYSMYGHIYRMSEAVMEGAREVALVSQAAKEHDLASHRLRSLAGLFPS